MSGSMRIQFDFYSKDEVSILLDGIWPPFGRNESELFIFACFILRQMYNLGKHFTSDAISAALLDEPEKLLGKNPRLSSGAELLAARQRYIMKDAGMSELECAFESSRIRQKLERNNPVMVLNRIALSKMPMPKIIEYKGKAQRQFIYNMPGQKLDIKGFGILGIGMGLGMNTIYYPFASSIALYRSLGNKHSDDAGYIKNLNLVGEICARIQIGGKIPYNQGAAGEYIIQKIIGDSEK